MKYKEYSWLEYLLANSLICLTVHIPSLGIRARTKMVSNLCLDDSINSLCYNREKRPKIMARLAPRCPKHQQPWHGRVLHLRAENGGRDRCDLRYKNSKKCGSKV